MKFKIVFNETEFFKKCKIKEQYLSHSKEKINELFKQVFEVKDYKNNTGKANNIKDYKITELFGSSQLNFFKIIELKGGKKEK